MKKVVLKVDVHDEKCKRRAMRIVSSLSGLDSIAMNVKEKKLTLTGDIDPVAIVSKLRKVYHNTEIISVEPVKEPEKKKDEPKKDQPKKSEPKAQAQMTPGFAHTCFYETPPCPPAQYYFVKSIEEDPNACVIC